MEDSKDKPQSWSKLGSRFESRWQRRSKSTYRLVRGLFIAACSFALVASAFHLLNTRTPTSPMQFWDEGALTSSMPESGSQMEPTIPAVTSEDTVTETEPSNEDAEQGVPAEGDAEGQIFSEEILAAPASPETQTSETELIESMIWPVDGTIVRTPGWYYSAVHNEWRYYSGVAISVDPGEEVKAAMSGRVRSIMSDPEAGQVVTVSHGVQSETIYSGLERVFVSIGSEVKRGQAIGEVSDTRELYFQVVDEEEPVDPRDAIDAPK